MERNLLTLDEVNRLDRQQFVARFGSLFEGSAWVAERGWEARPFQRFGQLHESLCAVMYDASMAQKLALIRAHPDLVGNAALVGALTEESTKEQSSAGLDSLSGEEVARFTRLNQEYRDRFGFPFVICARENKKNSILAGFEARLGNTQAEEIDTALGEITKIAHLRLADIVERDQ